MIKILCAGSLEKAKEIEDRIKQQYAESQHREKVLVRRLAAKEQEIQDYVVSYKTNVTNIRKLHFCLIIKAYCSNEVNL